MKKCSCLLWGALISLSIMGCSKQPAPEWQPGALYKPEQNPILFPDSNFTFFCPLQKDTVRWQKADVFNPAAIVRNDTVFLFYRSEDNPVAALGGRTSRIGLAWSTDGLHFTRLPAPVLYPNIDSFTVYDYPGGCEDPRIVASPDGRYIMTYTSWNQHTARLSVAVSYDLLHWQKTGPAFAKAYNGRYKDLWSKSGAIVTRFVNGVQVAEKIQGRYLMYWGDKKLNLAWSENLIDWHPNETAPGSLHYVAEPRPRTFESGLVEPGPPAFIQGNEIILLYNAQNSPDSADTDFTLPTGLYSAAQMTFDLSDPAKLLKRSDTPFLKPSLPHELKGQYKSGTTFLEGMVPFKGNWHLYYGTADSYVGVALSGATGHVSNR
ncbi:MAG: glycoside hydrolase family 130 protein [Chitinophagaceae bacterium]|nr:glycoside hydrolase family 130 protein [Chitinophagaceae bacterium]